MFQFTREFIINDNIGKLKGYDKDNSAANGVKFCFNRKADGSTLNSDVLYIDNLINLRKKDVNCVYEYDYVAEANESLTLALPVTAKVGGADSVDKGKVFRLVITLGQEGRVISTYNDQYPDHSRHFFYEAIADANGSYIDGLLEAFKHEESLSDVKFLKLSKDGSGNLVIDTPDCYTRIKEVRLVCLPIADVNSKIGAVLTGYEDYVEKFDITRKEFATRAAATDPDDPFVIAFTPGKLGAGNTVQILNNMRLRTAANIDPFGTQADERPIPGGHYTQYLVELVTERRHIGHDVVGSVGTSLTSHVFFVESAVASAFKAALTALTGAAPVKVGHSQAGSVSEPNPVLAKAKDVDAVADAVPTSAATTVELSGTVDTADGSVAGVTATATTTLS